MLTCGLVRSNFALATGGSSSLVLDSSAGCVQSDELLAADLLDDLVGDVLRNLGVRVELHRVRRLAGGLGPQVANAPQHPWQRNQSLDPPVPRALEHRLHLATARVDVADDVPEEGLRGGDLHL